MARPKKVKKEVEAKPHFSISITIGKDVYTGSGETALEALRNMNRPQKIMQKGVVILESEGKKAEILYMPIRLKRMLYPNSDVIIAKQLAYLVK